MLLIVKSRFDFAVVGSCVDRFARACPCSTARESAACAVSLNSGQIGQAGSASMQCRARVLAFVMGICKQLCTTRLSDPKLSQKKPGG